MENNSTVFRTDNPEFGFAAELVPHRSLGKTGFSFLMGFISVTCIIFGMMFVMMGAWPVFLFMVIDIAIIWFAFKINYRSAFQKELIHICKNELSVQKYDSAGHMVKHVFNPCSSHFEVKYHDEIGITAMRVTSADHELDIGCFLNPADRETFAAAFKNALAAAKSQ